MSDSIEEVALHETTRTRYLNYALSVITSRALPDVRDGLKPVQRRILYGMHQLHLSPDGKHKKSAQVVGEVMGKYHPHGDTALYDAMVRMAQPFSLRYTLVDGKGNFGSMDGDSAAAMRYTEARLAPIALELLNDLSEHIVDYRPTYDSSNQEPTVLPAGFPNLLANGATGIAVGMATNIPPHNLRELIDGCVLLIDQPDCTLERLVKVIPAPDFPTGGAILNTAEELLEIYTTGRGAIELRGEYHLEDEGRGNRIIITSVPYTVNKAQLVERIADHIRAGKLPLLVDVRDESTNEIRVVLELKTGADPEAVMAYVFKHTPLLSKFHVNLTCLVPVPGSDVCRPERLDLLTMLRHFLDFRFQVVTRRLQLELEKLLNRIHILEGFAILFDALDEAIAIIRESQDRKDAALKLGARFGIDELQQDAILETKLYKLAQLEIEKIRDELAARLAEAAHIQALLADDGERWKLIRDDLKALKRRFGDERLSRFAVETKTLAYSKEDYIVAEDVFVIVTRDGWLKRQRSYTGLSTIRVREGDEVGWSMYGSTRHSLILFSDRGKAYTLRIDSVPATTGFGDPVQAHFDFEDGERVVGMILTDPRCLPECEAPNRKQPALPFDDEVNDDEVATSEELEPHLVAFSRAGQTLRMSLKPYEPPSTVAGRLLMRLKPDEDDAMLDVLVSGGNELVSIISRASRALTFPVDEISVIKSPGKGVRAINLDKKDFVVGVALTDHRQDGLEVETNRGRSIVVSPRRFPPVTRGGRGRLIIRRGHIAKVLRPVVEIRPAVSEDAGTGSPTAPSELDELKDGLASWVELAPSGNCSSPLPNDHDGSEEEDD